MTRAVRRGDIVNAIHDKRQRARIARSPRRRPRFDAAVNSGPVFRDLHRSTAVIPLHVAVQRRRLPADAFDAFRTRFFFGGDRRGTTRVVPAPRGATTVILALMPCAPALIFVIVTNEFRSPYDFVLGRGRVRQRDIS